MLIPTRRDDHPPARGLAPLHIPFFIGLPGLYADEMIIDARCLARQRRRRQRTLIDGAGLGVGVQSRGPSKSPCSEETAIDSAVAEEAAILTGIGIGTAFGLLILLMVAIVLVRLSSAGILGRIEIIAAARLREAEAESRDKALAAVVAVTALRSSAAAENRREGNGG